MEILAAFFETTWPLTSVSLGAVLKQNEHGRTVGFIDAAESKFVYKVADPWKTEVTLANELLAFSLLPQSGFRHIPALMNAIDGKGYAEFDGRLVYVLEYVRGKTPNPTPSTYERLGLLTAELHSIQGYPYRTPFHPEAIVVNNLISKAERLPFKEQYLRIVDSLPIFTGLPETVIHTDISPANSIEAADGNFILIDWDDVGVGIRILDIAFPLIQQFISEEGVFLQDNASAFYSAYFSRERLTVEELDHVFPMALVVALMYIIYGDTTKRWNRIQWAIKNRNVLEGTLRAIHDRARNYIETS